MPLQRVFVVLVVSMVTLGSPNVGAVPDVGKLKAKLSSDLAATQKNWLKDRVQLHLISIDAAPTRGFEYEVEAVVKVTATKDLYRDIGFAQVVGDTAPRDLAVSVEGALGGDLVGDDDFHGGRKAPRLKRYVDAATLDQLAFRYQAACGKFQTLVRAVGASWTGRVSRTMRYSNGEWSYSEIPAHFVGLPYLPAVPVGEVNLHDTFELRSASGVESAESPPAICRRNYVVGTLEATNAINELLAIALQVRDARVGSSR